MTPITSLSKFGGDLFISSILSLLSSSSIDMSLPGYPVSNFTDWVRVSKRVTLQGHLQCFDALQLFQRNSRLTGREQSSEDLRVVYYEDRMVAALDSCKRDLMQASGVSIYMHKCFVDESGSCTVPPGAPPRNLKNRPTSFPTQALKNFQSSLRLRACST